MGFFCTYNILFWKTVLYLKKSFRLQKLRHPLREYLKKIEKAYRRTVDTKLIEITSIQYVSKYSNHI